jgi:hypothetical protein
MRAAFPGRPVFAVLASHHHEQFLAGVAVDVLLRFGYSSLGLCAASAQHCGDMMKAR